MQKAIRVSSSSEPSSSSSSYSGIDKFAQEQSDRENLNRLKRMQKNLDRLKRKQKNLNRLKIMQKNLNRLILDVPEDEWRKTSHDYLEKPHGLFKVYFKGLVSDETVMNVKKSFAGIGVAICDMRDRCVFELWKPVAICGDGGRKEDGDVVELKALFEGLNAAFTLGLKWVHIFCESNSVYQYLNRTRKPANNQIVTLLDELIIIQRKLGYHGPFHVRQNNAKFAYKLVRDAIASQATKFANTAFEKCTICLESIYSEKMFSVNKCLHRYCFSCMTNHIKAKLLEGKLPDCPHEKCRSNLEIKSCKLFLNQNLYNIMGLRVKEASIPPTDRVYCPFSNCSALMSKTEVHATSSSTPAGRIGMRKCVKCHHRFCINCKVPWHYKVTCSDYMKSFPYQSSNEAKLKSLATNNRWRQCIKCMNMVELSGGCYHINCRCGYEFCYACGAEWIKKNPTCRCPHWDERLIVYD